MRDDVVRRPLPDRVRVDPRDQAGNEDDEPDRLEQPQEREADQRRSGKLAEVRDLAEPRGLEAPRDQPERETRRKRSPPAPERQREIDEPEHGRDEDERDPGYVPPGRGVPERGRPGVVAGDRGRERDEQRDARAQAQYGGSAAHQSPSDLKAFQKAVFAGCSSSDASTSGTTRASTVGVNCWSTPSAASSGRDSGNSTVFRNSSACSPITTTSFGWTMWSSRVSQSRASWSGVEPAYLRQFVP